MLHRLISTLNSLSRLVLCTKIRDQTQVSNKKFIIQAYVVCFVNNIENKFNGVNTKALNSTFNAMKNKPEIAKVTFFVKSAWNGGFSVRSSS